MRLGALHLASALAWLNAAAGIAAWEPSGLPVCGPDCQAGEPYFVLSDGEHGLFVAWSGGGGQSIDSDIFLQRITPDGQIAPGWPQEGFPVCVLAGAQDLWSLSTDGFGGVLLTWQDWRVPDADIYVQRVLGSGVVAPGWPANGVQACGNSANQNFAAICSDGSGGAFVAWEDRRDIATLREDVYAQHIMASGSRATPWTTSRASRG